MHPVNRHFKSTETPKRILNHPLLPLYTDSKRKCIVASVLLYGHCVLLGTEMSAASGGVSESEVQ